MDPDRGANVLLIPSTSSLRHLQKHCRRHIELDANTRRQLNAIAWPEAA